jgi:plastocyanin
MRLLAIGVFGGLIAAGTISAAPSIPAPSRDTTIAIQTFRFRPAELEIPVGTRVTWNNSDDIEHTVTAGIPDSAGGAFNGKLAILGATFAQTFNRAGTFAYFCDRHHFMRGTIRVTPTGEN